MNRRFWAFLFVAAALAAAGGARGAQDTRYYESLRNPQIRHGVAPEKMVVLEAKGDPESKGQAVFQRLFRIFFNIQGVRLAPPRVRWLTPLTGAREDWIGLYALPLPGQIAELPPGSDSARIEVWPYGDVAEILHVGPYSDEAGSISRLEQFIRDQGYEIRGHLEEEYVRGPDTVSSPSEYWTVLRYQVKGR